MNESLVMQQWDLKTNLTSKNDLQCNWQQLYVNLIDLIKKQCNNVFFDETYLDNINENQCFVITVLGSILAANDLKRVIKDYLNINKISFSSIDVKDMGMVKMPINDKIRYDGWLKVNSRVVGEKEYDILQNYSAVTALIVNELSEVLVVKQFRPSIMTITYELPAGCLDDNNESDVETMVRELSEETNLSLSKSRLQKLVTYYSALGHSNSTNTVYYASVAKNEIANNSINDEDVLDIIWLPFKKFERYINQGIIKDSKSIIAYYHYKLYLDRKIQSIH